jgi:hypothetical protein
MPLLTALQPGVMAKNKAETESRKVMQGKKICVYPLFHGSKSEACGRLL